MATGSGRPWRGEGDRRRETGAARIPRIRHRVRADVPTDDFEHISAGHEPIARSRRFVWAHVLRGVRAHDAGTRHRLRRHRDIRPPRHAPAAPYKTVEARRGRSTPPHRPALRLSGKCTYATTPDRCIRSWPAPDHRHGPAHRSRSPQQNSPGSNDLRTRQRQFPTHVPSRSLILLGLLSQASFSSQQDRSSWALP